MAYQPVIYVWELHYSLEHRNQNQKASPVQRNKKIDHQGSIPVCKSWLYTEVFNRIHVSDACNWYTPKSTSINTSNIMKCLSTLVIGFSNPNVYSKKKSLPVHCETWVYYHSLYLCEWLLVNVSTPKLSNNFCTHTLSVPLSTWNQVSVVQWISNKRMYLF